MPSKYPDAAVELARSLYLKYGGGNFEAIEAEMRRAGYHNWSRQNLSRADDKNWVRRYGFERSLATHIQNAAIRRAETQGEKQLRQLAGVRDRLYEEIESGKFDAKTLDTFRGTCSQITEMLSKLRAGTNTLEAFVVSWETLLEVLGELKPELIGELLNIGDEIFEKVRVKFGG
jgi:hypothetical protein